MTNKIFLTIASVVVFALSMAYYVLRFPAPDRVAFTGDSYDYQALAVNLIKGHGYRIGAIEDLQTYALTGMEKHPELFREFETEIQHGFYRAPAYPFFMALIYQLGGVHPKNVVVAQMLLLALSAAMLVGLGFLFWGVWGIASGVVAGLLYTVFFSPAPNEIMGEPLLIVCLFLWAFSYVYWKKERSVRATILLGFLTAVLFLIKELVVFLPLIWAAYYVLVVQDELKRKLLIVAVYFVSLFAAFLPWTIYAHQQSGGIVVSTTHGRHALLDGNNEDSFGSGRWSPSWRKERAGDTSYFYNRPDIKNKPYVEQYLGFLIQYRERLPELFTTKLLRAFTYNKLFFWTLLLIFLYYMLTLFRRFYPQVPLHYGELPLFFLINIVLLTVVLYAMERFTQTFMYFFLPCAVHAMIALIYLAVKSLESKK